VDVALIAGVAAQGVMWWDGTSVPVVVGTAGLVGVAADCVLPVWRWWSGGRCGGGVGARSGQRRG
jgi:hypothetical protein